ncbi:MAG: NADH-quinone oxidoreductase subunit C [Candidatus Eisenbacteria bacterium]|uniref:NADH-quinone oxidoreductase subunit C n=1 Tax=Eiseniibacteriota bacterium TaxID=2212470 RepID=A0A7Y2EDC9_UNCEI|nr:NADH-quinone oxidoreductase subunit C [Candidatus Eisenbacteria bacterium]
MTKPPKDHGTPADTQPFGLPAGEVEEEGNLESTNTDLGFDQRTALALKEQFGDQVLEIVTFRKEWTTVVKPGALIDVMTFLRDQWSYKMCHDVTSVDLYPHEPRFMVVYHLVNLDRSTRFRVKTPVSSDHAEVDTVVGLWPGASLMEREVYDLMGIKFKDHPDLRRVLLPDDWDGHPLRKDYPLTGFDVGVDTFKE